MVNITMNDVAREAGVSQSTVSAVLNNNPKIKIARKTRERIQSTVKKLGYRPNSAAKALKSRNSFTIGIIAENIATSPFAGDIIKGAQHVAGSSGRTIMVMDTEGNKKAMGSALEFMLEKQVEGILFASMYSREINLPKDFKTVRTVMVNCFGTESCYPSVIPDDRWGGYFVTRTFIAKNHRRIALINGESGFHAARERLVGYQSALKEANVSYESNLVSFGSWWPENGYDNACRLMKMPNPPTALFCGNDRIAIGAMMAVKELGINVPKDVAVIGYDGQEIAGHLSPALTTFTIPHYKMGVWGIETLLGIKNDPDESYPVVKVKGKMIPGASC
ncbi:MAG: LacI family DNA-binding transcriptional regulator [Proteobacteria bacterium]|nr:LacI family DNA-binding transcriptional regulator [Pseudomonadota bacterium]